MARYSQQDKDRAMGALMASAVEGPDGEWVPNLYGVQEALGISDRTLKRWWDARDVSRDAELRGVTTHAREKLTEEGVDAWLERMWADWRDMAERIKEPDAWAGLKADGRARATLLTRQALSGVRVELVNGDATKGTEGRLDRIRRKAKAAGLLK